MELLQVINSTIAPMLLTITMSYLIFQCGKKKAPPESTLKEPPYPNATMPIKEGVIPTEDQYIFYNYPYKRKPESKPPQEEIAEMIAIREAAKNEETRKKWGEEYFLKKKNTGPQLKSKMNEVGDGGAVKTDQAEEKTK